MIKKTFAMLLCVMSVFVAVFCTNTDYAVADTAKDKVATVTYSYVLGEYGLSKSYAVVLNSDKFPLQNHKGEKVDESYVILALNTMFERLGYKVTIPQGKVGELTAIKAYESLTDYYKELGITGNEKPTPSSNKVDKGFLFNTVYINVGNYLASLQNAKYLETITSNGYPLQGLDISYDDLQFDFVYGSPYKVENDGNIMKKDKLTLVGFYDLKADSEVIIIRQTPNTYVWYIGCIVIALVFIAISYGARKVYKKNTKLR